MVLHRPLAGSSIMLAANRVPDGFDGLESIRQEGDSKAAGLEGRSRTSMALDR